MPAPADDRFLTVHQLATQQRIDDHIDVNVTGRGDQYLLQWDAGASEHVYAPAGAPGPHTLDSHSNVDTTGKATNDILKWDGANWVDGRVAAGEVVAGTFPAGIFGFTGAVITAASTATIAGLRIPHGTAPSAPVNGAMWTTTGGLFARINGTTRQYMNLSGAQTVSGVKTHTARPAFNSTGAPFTVTSTTVVTNLNADTVDGIHGTSFVRLDPAGSQTIEHAAVGNVLALAGPDATGGGTLQDSPRLRFTSSYWDGLGPQDFVADIWLDVQSTTPTGELLIQIAGTTKLFIGSAGYAVIAEHLYVGGGTIFFATGDDGEKIVRSGDDLSVYNAGSVTTVFRAADVQINPAVVIFNQAVNTLIRQNTANDDDTSSISIAGAGATGATRGAYLTLTGNENVSAPGTAFLAAGDTGILWFVGPSLQLDAGVVTHDDGTVTAELGPGAGPAGATEYGVGTTSTHDLVLYANNTKVLECENDGELVYFGGLALRANADANGTLGTATVRWETLFVGNATNPPTAVAIEADGQIVSNRHDLGNSGAGTLTLNWHNGNSQRVKATGDFTTSLSNGVAGASYVLEIEADGTQRAPTWTGIDWGTAGAPTMPTTNTDVIYVVIVYNGTSYHGSWNGNTY